MWRLVLALVYIGVHFGLLVGCASTGETEGGAISAPSVLQDRLQTLFQHECESPVPFSGSVLVCQQNKTLLESSFATSALPFKATDYAAPKYFIASFTKHFTAVAILQLYAAGKLDLHQKVSDFLPALPWGDSVNIYQLLSHQSGIVRDVVTVYDQAITLDSFMGLLAETQLQFQAGSQFSYANPNYLILSKIIELVSGQSYFDFIRDQILVPCGMIHTGQQSTSTPSVGLAVGQSIGYDSLSASTTVVPSMPFVSASRYGAGALYSTLEDLYQYYLHYQSRTLLPDSLYQLMETASSENYGLGWFVDSTAAFGKKIWHTGRTYGYRSGFYLYPDHEVCVIMLCNYDLSDRNGIMQRLEGLLFQDTLALPPLPRLIQAPVVADFAPYLGQFLLEGDTPMDLYEMKGNFYVESHGGPRELIYPDSDSTFTSLLRDMQFEFSRLEGVQVDTLYWTYRGDRFACPRRD